MSCLSVEVPFTQIGNRRGFTHEQLLGDPVCEDFYRRFKHCFEPHPDFNVDVVLFIEPQETTP